MPHNRVRKTALHPRVRDALLLRTRWLRRNKKAPLVLEVGAFEDSRRILLGRGIGMLGAAAVGPWARASDTPDGGQTASGSSPDPLEPALGDYTVVFDHCAEIPMADGYILTDAPSLVRTADGALLCSVPLMLRGTPNEPSKTGVRNRSRKTTSWWTGSTILMIEPGASARRLAAPTRRRERGKSPSAARLAPGTAWPLVLR